MPPQVSPPSSLTGGLSAVDVFQGRVRAALGSRGALVPPGGPFHGCRHEAVVFPSACLKTLIHAFIFSVLLFALGAFRLTCMDVAAGQVHSKNQTGCWD